jgi:hypothetical protein
VEFADFEYPYCARMSGELESWRVHDFFFSNQSGINVSKINGKTTAFIVSSTHLDADKFDSCIKEHQFANAVPKM